MIKNMTTILGNKYLLLILISLSLLVTNSIKAELPDDQKPFYDILIISNPNSSEYREELFISNIDGEPIVNKDKINTKNKIRLNIQNCLLTDLQLNAGGINSTLYRNIANDLEHVLKVQTFYKNSGKIDQLYNSVWYIFEEKLKQFYPNYEYYYECPYGRVPMNRAGVNMLSGTYDFFLIPRYLLELVNIQYKAYSQPEINENNIFDTITYDQLLSKDIQLVKEEKSKKDKYNKKIQELEVLANNKSIDFTYELIFKNDDDIRPCSTSRVEAQSVLGHVILFKKFNKQQPNDKVSNVFKNIEDAYQNIKEKNDCTVYIDYPENIYKLHKALNRDKVYNTVGNRLESVKGKKAFVTHHGFKSIEEYDLAWNLNIKKELIRDLAKFKIDSVDKYNKIQERMLKSGYSESKNVRDVLSYLSDLEEARSKGIDILKQRDIRIQALKKEREAQAAKKEKQKIAYAKKYPYYAVLSCEANGSHANILACFSGGQYGADTDFTLNGKIYKAYNINQVGRENSEGLAFDLTNDFSVVAQNANDFLILKLVITNRLTNKIVYQKEVGQYGVIRISD